MTDFAVKLAWFLPETDTHEVVCPDCGAVVTVAPAVKASRCADCARERNNKHSKAYQRGLHFTDNETVDLAYAVIHNAIMQAQAGDRDAAQFLVAHDGAELWLRACGIGVTQAMRAELRRKAGQR